MSKFNEVIARRALRNKGLSLSPKFPVHRLSCLYHALKVPYRIRRETKVVISLEEAKSLLEVNGLISTEGDPFTQLNLLGGLYMIHYLLGVPEGVPKLPFVPVVTYPILYTQRERYILNQLPDRIVFINSGARSVLNEVGVGKKEKRKGSRFLWFLLGNSQNTLFPLTPEEVLVQLTKTATSPTLTLNGRGTEVLSYLPSLKGLLTELKSSFYGVQIRRKLLTLIRCLELTEKFKEELKYLRYNNESSQENKLFQLILAGAFFQPILKPEDFPWYCRLREEEVEVRRKVLLPSTGLPKVLINYSLEFVLPILVTREGALKEGADDH